MKFYEQIVKVLTAFGERHSLDEFGSAYFLLCSRFFGIPGYDPKRAFLVPYADMANTNCFEKRNTVWEYDEVQERFKLIALTDIKKGEPVK